MSPQQFMTSFVSRSRPLLLRGFLLAPGNGSISSGAAFLDALSAESLLKQYGDLRFPVAATPYARAFGGTAQELPLRDYAAVAGLVPQGSGGGGAGGGRSEAVAESEAAIGASGQLYVFDAPGGRHAAEGAGSSGAALPRWLSDPLAAALLERVQGTLLPPLLAAARVPLRDEALFDALVAAPAGGGGSGAAELDLRSLAQALGDAAEQGEETAGPDELHSLSSREGGEDPSVGPPDATLRSRLVDAAMQLAARRLGSNGSVDGGDVDEEEEEAAAALLALPAQGSAAEAVRTQLLLDPARAPPKPQLFLGPAGSGAPPHFHKDALNVLAHGQKRWWLSPPRWATYSSAPVAEWLVQTFGAREAEGAEWVEAEGGWRAHVLECTQNAGDALFVPYGWGHAVLNLHASAGFALEFSTALAPRG